MKAFKITSPCYIANGYNGTYISVAITDNDGNLVKGYGDHFFSGNVIHVVERPYENPITNVYEAVGMNYSDDDRPISIEEVELDMDRLKEWEEGVQHQEEVRKQYEDKKVARFGPHVGFYVTANKPTKKEEEARWEEFRQWKKENPIPKTQYHCYDFLKAIIQ